MKILWIFFIWNGLDIDKCIWIYMLNIFKKKWNFNLIKLWNLKIEKINDVVWLFVGWLIVWCIYDIYVYSMNECIIGVEYVNLYIYKLYCNV